MATVISVLIENEVGALSRVVSLFSARGYNIESLTVAPTDDPSMSRMTIATDGSKANSEQITKQLNKLIDVVRLQELSNDNHYIRELGLVRVRCETAEDRSELTRLTDIFNARVIDLYNNLYVIEIIGLPKKVDSFVNALLFAKLKIDVVRSGSVGI